MARSKNELVFLPVYTNNGLNKETVKVYLVDTLNGFYSIQYFRLMRRSSLNAKAQVIPVTSMTTRRKHSEYRPVKDAPKNLLTFNRWIEYVKIPKH